MSPCVGIDKPFVCGEVGHPVGQPRVDQRHGVGMRTADGLEQPRLPSPRQFVQAAPAAAASLIDVIVRQPDYLKTLDGALTEAPLQIWKDYLTFGTSAAYADYLPAAFVDALIRNLLAAFTAGIDELEWMSPATKVQA